MPYPATANERYLIVKEKKNVRKNISFFVLLSVDFDKWLWGLLTRLLAFPPLVFLWQKMIMIWDTFAVWRNLHLLASEYSEQTTISTKRKCIMSSYKWIWKWEISSKQWYIQQTFQQFGQARLYSCWVQKLTAI